MTDCYLRYPHLAGDRLVFVADDDVWTAPVTGGRATRLTADRSPALRPRLSPDGSLLAWVSQRAGRPEAFAMPAGGGDLRQLSYFGSEWTNILGFDPAGRLVVVTPAGQPVTSQRWAWAIDPADPAPELLPYGPICDIAWGASSPGAVLVSTGLYREPAQWKRYRGGTAGRLWLDPAGDGEFAEILAELAGPKVCPVAIGDRYAFLADFEGHGNVYSVDAAGGDLRRHTDHDRYYARQLAGDGTRLVYQHAGQVWLLSDLSADSPPRRIDLELAGPRLGRLPVELTAAKHLGAYAVDQTGRASAVEVRGNVVWLTHRDGPVRTVAASPGVRHRLPVLLAGSAAGQSIAYVTSADGPDAIEIASENGSENGGARRYGAGELGRVLELAAAPDGSRLAICTHDGRVLTMAVADGSITELLANPHGDPRQLSWSPDSAWLAFAVPERTPGTSSIRICELASGTVHPLTRERFADTEPVFSTDGRYLAFLSTRTFDPVYDSQVFDLSFAAGSRPYLVTLAADTDSPFAPVLAGQPVTEAPAAESAPDAPPAVRVEPDGIEQRVLPFPVPAGRYRQLTAVTGGFAWLDRPAAGELGESRLPAADVRPSLQRWDFGKRAQVELCPHLDRVRASGDGRRLLIQDRDALRLVPADRPAAEDGPDAAIVPDMARIRLTVDPPAEWAQMLAETGRLMADHFWTEDLAGVDWTAAVAKYAELIPAIASRDDLSDLLWELNGETGTSHAYESQPKPEVDPRLMPAYLGADLARQPDGRWLVRRVVPGDNSSRGARSPLTAPGAGVLAGDQLVAVNGRPVGPAGPAPLLRGTADQPVELRLLRDGQPRTALVQPIPDERELRYLDWVASRRRLVHQASGGRIGYLHVPDMMSSGWAAFHRDLNVEMGRDALVVDTRNNSGGHVSELVIEKLSRSLRAWNMPRHLSPISYPHNAPRGPLVSLANEWAGSDGDIVNVSFQALGLGPVIGRRTWGGVVGIDNRYDLVDGSGVTQPRFAFWFPAHGWGVENHGVDPDQVVEMPPQAWAAGADPILDAGLRYLLAELDRRGPQPLPDPATRPDRRAPELPPRPLGG